MKNKKCVIDFLQHQLNSKDKLRLFFAASEPLDIETIEKRVETSVNLKDIREFTSYI